jgi:type I restriction enzyme S subunit
MGHCIVNGVAKTIGVAELRRFRPYPAYKDSGVEWLGKIPAIWGVKRLKRIVKFGGGGTPSKENIEYWRGDIPWVSPKDMKVSVVSDTEDKITAQAVSESATKLVPAGAVLIVVRSGILIHSIPVALAGREVTLNQDLKALIPTPEIVSKYLAYLISGMQRELLAEWKKEGATVESLELDLVANTPTPLPSTLEQHAIATFLDRETSKIDALVAKKERLIELLQEKRTAFITRAVTKGLDPNVPMKESGVAWLREIPAHWEHGRLHSFWTVIDCKHRTAVYVDEGIPIVSTTEVKPGRLRLDGPRRVSEPDFDDLTGGGRRPRRGNIVYSRNASVGSAAYIDTDEPFCMGQDVWLITSAGDQLYLTYQLNSPTVLGQIEAVSVGSTFQRINVAQIKNFHVVRPPQNEQNAIAAVLDGETTKIDVLIGKVREAIDRLKELRASLISASVTGKIDVREEAA